MLCEYVEWFGAAVLAFACSSLLGICEGPHPDAGSSGARWFLCSVFCFVCLLQVYGLFRVGLRPIRSAFPQFYGDTFWIVLCIVCWFTLGLTQAIPSMA